MVSVLRCCVCVCELTAKTYLPTDMNIKYPEPERTESSLLEKDTKSVENMTIIMLLQVHSMYKECPTQGPRESTSCQTTQMYCAVRHNDFFHLAILCNIRENEASVVKERCRRLFRQISVISLTK